ncbi:hypothetical protein H6F97_17500 [Microcoleus sp. FACHB-1]|nr:hypothetical protein [Microcoleus sp. FACHB-1]
MIESQSVWLSLRLGLPNPVNCVDDALALNDFDALDTDFAILQSEGRSYVVQTDFSH